ncbi:MAG: hypothetical protein IKC83_03625, partial [Clostridia bacterium]|nr:hypothetical protein [Clostridia bacterium]
YPVANPEYMKRDEVELAVQLNSKMRTRITVSSSLSKDELEKAVLDMDEVKQVIGNLTVRKVIVIPGRLINIVAG